MENLDLGTSEILRLLDKKLTAGDKYSQIFNILKKKMKLIAQLYLILLTPKQIVT